MSISPVQPISVALANDYELVVLGLAHLLAPYPERVRMVEMVAGVQVTSDVDLTLYDTFAQPQVDTEDIERVIAGDGAGRVVVFTWNLQAELIEIALKKGASGYLSKALSGEELIETLERIHAGEVIVSPAVEAAETASEEWDGGLWPGQTDGLTVRESEVIALITLGLSNQEIAKRAYLSINSVKSYIRSAYRKMGVTTRSQAVLWAVHHGFLPDSVRFGGEPEGQSTA